MALHQIPAFQTLKPRGVQSSPALFFLFWVANRFLGVLNINRIQKIPPFSSDELIEAGVVASQAALVLENRRLVDELKTKMTELASTQSQIAAVERFAAIGELASGIAHEINNPVAFTMANCSFVSDQLNSLKTEIDGASEEKIGPVLISWFQSIGKKTGLDDLVSAMEDSHEGTKRITEIVRDIRQLARAEMGGDALVDLNQAIQTALRLATPATRGLAEMEVALGNHVTVQGNIAQLTQVFIKLIITAARATPQEPKPVPKVTVKSWRENDRVFATVTDRGAGIPKDLCEKIFDPFFVHAPNIPNELNLGISRDVIVRHLGEISFETQTGLGTTFTISLPATDRVQEDGVQEESVLQKSQTSDEISKQDLFSRKRILIVEDEEQLRRSYSRFFLNRHDLVFARNGIEAAEILARDRAFDLILCDIIMPGMTGAALFQQVSKEFPGIEKKFLFVTGAFGRQEVRDFVATTKTRVLAKPFPLEKILEHL